MNSYRVLHGRSATMRATLAGSLLVTLALSATNVSAQASSAGDPVAPPAGATGGGEALETTAPDDSAARALARLNGIPVSQARQQLREQSRTIALAEELGERLGDAAAGSYIDDDGDLVVTVVSRAAAVRVRAAGALPERVDDSQARLDAIMIRLDALADRAGSVQGWYVDVPGNSVVVTTTRGSTDAQSRRLVRVARSFGDSVRLEQSPAWAAPTITENLYGGTEYVPGSGTCSIGFNAVDSSNRHVVVTAGHCLRSGPTVSRNGYIIGATRTADFPNDDFGTFWNSYPSYWRPNASVNRYNGTAMAVRGSWANPPIGATVCKSGRTTYWTCGTLQATNQTVNYGNGRVVYGLVRHTACVEEGDSGGSNISTGGYALGLTSGASLYLQGGRKVCGQKVGVANTSFYQPIAEALNRNGLRLLVAG